MPVAIRINVESFKEQLKANLEQLQKATRPAAQAGVQIIYDRARLVVEDSDRTHMFHIRGQVYGPYAPGNLRRAIYQVFSEEKSFKDVSTYQVSWNKDKAPYGHMVETGTSTAPAYSFIGRAVIETRKEVRAAIKARFIQEASK